jgi:hypothetical protein
VLNHSTLAFSNLLRTKNWVINKSKGSKSRLIEIMRIQLNIRKKLLGTYSMKNLASSVGDQGCLSRMLIFINSRILDLGSQIQQQQKGKGKFKFKFILLFEHVQKIFFNQLTKNYSTFFFTQKLSLSSQKYGLRISCI